jgi:hypothetical protein
LSHNVHHFLDLRSVLDREHGVTIFFVVWERFFTWRNAGDTQYRDEVQQTPDSNNGQ